MGRYENDTLVQHQMKSKMKLPGVTGVLRNRHHRVFDTRPHYVMAYRNRWAFVQVYSLNQSNDTNDNGVSMGHTRTDHSIFYQKPP